MSEEEVDTLDDLYRKELAELADLETRQAQFLETCADSIHDQNFADLVRSHQEETKAQCERIQAIGTSAQPAEFKAAAEMMASCLKLSNDQDSQPEVIDAAILSSLQGLKHLEIAKYGTVRSYSEDLGLVEVADALTLSLEEDARFDRELTRLAQRYINFRAADQ